MVNDDEMYNSFKRCAQLGALPLVHAENGDVVARMQADLLARGVTGPEGHSYSRPPEVEGEAANRAIMIADMAGVPLYIVHVSCEQTHDAIRRAKQAGQRVYGEPLVQYLVLDDSEYQNKDWDHAAGRVMSPPFRNKKHQDSLWAGLQSGTLSVVATDHATFTRAQKRMGAQELHANSQRHGRPEDRMPVLWTSGRQHRPPDQGRICGGDFHQHREDPQHVSAQGRDAGRSRCRHRDLGPERHQDHHGEEAAASEYNVFEGFKCVGHAPHGDLARQGRGEQGDMRAKAGDGDFVPRKPNAPVHQANAIWKGVTQPKGVERIEVTP
jgi:dihydropyrimidinase